MRYIITGGAGFIGAHLAEALVNNEQEVIVIDNLASGVIQNLKQLFQNEKFTFINSDVCQISDWKSLLQKHSTIIHLAATVGVNMVMKDALETIDNNFFPTKKLLDAAVKYKCRFFFSSTSEVYGDLNKLHSTETDPLVVLPTYCGRSGYVLGKVMSEYYCLNYHHRFGLPVIIGRLFNITGIRQTHHHGMVVPSFIQQALSGNPLTLYGDGNQTRSFCHVKDLVRAILSLLECEKAYGQIFNIGSEENITIKNLARHIKSATKSTSPILLKPFPHQRSDGRDIRHRKPSLTKIRNFIGWEPSIPWVHTVNEMIAYEMAKIETAFTNQKMLI